MARPRTVVRRPQAGFSLLETIAAILLLALAFGAVMHVAGAATEVTVHARELTRVSMWADATLDSIGRREPLHVGKQEGTYDAQYRWRLVVSAQEPLPGQIRDLHLYRIDLDILWGSGRAARSAHFATQRLQDEPVTVSTTSVAGS
jgi:general secretion pathway protein I